MKSRITHGPKRTDPEMVATPSPPSGADLTPLSVLSQATEGPLVDRVSALIEQAQAFAAAQVNLTMTLRNWYVGRMVHVDVLGETRAEYGKQIVVTLSRQLVERYGRSLEEKNLRRMIQFSQVFPDEEIVASLGRRLTEPRRAKPLICSLRSCRTWPTRS